MSESVAHTISHGSCHTWIAAVSLSNLSGAVPQSRGEHRRQLMSFVCVCGYGAIGVLDQIALCLGCNFIGESGK